MSVRVRIAPSPTGSIHVGLARTALYNALFARQHGGTFVLRIEDTDEKRNVEESEREIYEGLRWLGLAWDEGPDRGGEYGPYRQSERTALYRQYLEQLFAEKKIYPCYCTPQELEQERAEQVKRGAAPVYSGRCRSASAEQITVWQAEGRKPMYRFATQSEKITFEDLVRGCVEFHAEHIGDFSVARDFDHPLYNFAVVIDDALMNISHVIRGEEHLSNTPKQILLLRALKLPQPLYAHLPLLLGPSRKKLSKRDGATSIGEYREQGFLPEALVNFLALLGWHPKDDRERFTFDELMQTFKLEDVQKAGAIFDRKKLESMNGQYIRSLTPKELIQRSGEALEPLRKRLRPEALEKAIRLAQDRLVTLRELPEALTFFHTPRDYPVELLVPKQGSLEQTQDVLANLREFFGSLPAEHLENEQKGQETTVRWIAEHGFSNAEALWPLRVAVTGMKNSPGVFEVMAVLGKEETRRRIDVALKKLKQT